MHATYFCQKNNLYKHLQVSFYGKYIVYTPHHSSLTLKRLHNLSFPLMLIYHLYPAFKYIYVVTLIRFACYRKHF